MEKLKLKQVAYTVTGIFTLFGGFLNSIGPPVRFSHFITGPAQVIVLIVGFFILNTRNGLSTVVKKYVLSGLIILLVCSIFGYYNVYSKYVMKLPSNDSTVVIGSVHTPSVIRTCGHSFPKYDGCETYYLNLSVRHTKIGVESIWTSESILKNELMLLGIYWFISVIFSAAVFLFSEQEPEKDAEPVHQETPN
ncbi:hypothetical protein [Mucilaginibacter sp.]|uniref:hypothetical protein n=1 Tax=Mucilaginibacter sp. TaxID=1882438 RepID=UPI002ED110E6